MYTMFESSFFDVRRFQSVTPAFAENRSQFCPPHHSSGRQKHCPNAIETNATQKKTLAAAKNPSKSNEKPPKNKVLIRKMCFFLARLLFFNGAWCHF